MKVDELREVLDERFERHEKHEDDQHAEIIKHFDRINGKVAEHGKEITDLKIKAWVVIGVALILWNILHFLIKF